MYRSCLFAAILLLLSAPPAMAQNESLCNPCVDYPVNRIRRDGFTAPNATTVITAEDMRRLGVVSVADMVAQLPKPLAVPLGEPSMYPPQNRSVYSAAARHIEELDLELDGVLARLVVCGATGCSVDVYPEQLTQSNLENREGCQPGYCATLNYSLEEGRITDVSVW